MPVQSRAFRGWGLGGGVAQVVSSKGWVSPRGGWPVFALGISHWSQKHFRNVPQSDPLAPAQLTRWAAIGSSGGQLSENTASAAIHSRFAVASNCGPRCLPARRRRRHGDSPSTYDHRRAGRCKNTTLGRTNNGSQSGR